VTAGVRDHGVPPALDLSLLQPAGAAQRIEGWLHEEGDGQGSRVPLLDIELDHRARRIGPTAEILGLIACAFVLAIGLPLVTTVVGLMLFGILHNFLELRYVLTRYREVLASRVLGVSLALITPVAVLRLLGPLTGARRGELVLGGVMLAGGIAWGARRHRALAVAGLPVGLVVLWMGWHSIGTYFVVITYLHNLVPVVFLWDWAEDGIASAGARRLFRGVQLVWLVVVPVILLAGVAPIAAPGSLVAFAGPAAGHAAAVTPAALASAVDPARFLALFAFLQTLHYGIWCWFFPRRTRRAVATAPPRRAPRWLCASVLGLAKRLRAGVRGDVGDDEDLLHVDGLVSCLPRVHPAGDPSGRHGRTADGSADDDRGRPMTSMPVLADAAPTGTGLAIVGVILLVFVAVSLAALILVIRFFVRRARRNNPPDDQTG
jgi:hypothetical protein